jgi:hypothetical protein
VNEGPAPGHCSRRARGVKWLSDDSRQRRLIMRALCTLVILLGLLTPGYAADEGKTAPQKDDKLWDLPKVDFKDDFTLQFDSSNPRGLATPNPSGQYQLRHQNEDQPFFGLSISKPLHD